MGKLTLVVARNLHLKNLELDRFHHEFTKFLEPGNRTYLIRIEDVFKAYKVPPARGEPRARLVPSRVSSFNAHRKRSSSNKSV
jgi:hypothetical protein